MAINATFRGGLLFCPAAHVVGRGLHVAAAAADPASVVRNWRRDNIADCLIVGKLIDVSDMVGDRLRFFICQPVKFFIDVRSSS